MTSELLGLGPRQSWRAETNKPAYKKIFWKHGLQILTEPCKPIWFHSRTEFIFLLKVSVFAWKTTSWFKRRTIQPNAQHSYWSGWNWKFDELAPKGLLRLKWNSLGQSKLFFLILIKTAIFDYGNEQIIDETTLWASLSVNSAGSAIRYKSSSHLV
jgi:hypothetical protein